MNPKHPLPCSIEELRGLDFSEQVDMICTALEESWKNGTQLDLRECVSWVEPAYQKKILYELMLVEKECREFHPPVTIEAPNEFLAFDSKHASADTMENFSNETISTEAKPNQLPLYIDRFAIIKLIGKGSFGDVYAAEDVSIHRRVAVKVAIEARKSLRTFAKEAENANRVGHPSIVRIYDVGSWRGLDYLVSELIDGKPLGQFNETAALNFVGCARVVIEIAEAIAAAHVAGVIHRDLKPSNIMIEAIDRLKNQQSDGIAQDPLFEHHRVRVLDFGIAKLDSRATQLTRIGDILGTPHYMSPEQAAGRADSVDGRSDIYSMGVILFELLTGKLPFQGPDSVIINSIRSLKAPRVQSLRSDVPETLDRIVKRCLETDPENRYQTASELANDLREWIEGRKPRSIVLEDRRRLATGMTLVSAACLLLAVSISAILFLPSRGNRNQPDSDAPSSTKPEIAAAPKLISRWVRDGKLAEFADWLATANATSNALLFAELDELKLTGNLSKAEQKRLEFARVCITDEIPSETESKEVLAGFIQELELSQLDLLRVFLQSAPNWIVGSFISLPKAEIDDTKRSYLYRGLAQRLRSNGDEERLLELLRLSETAELPTVLTCMIETVSGSTPWLTKIREQFDNTKLSSRMTTAELDNIGRWKAKCALVAYGLGEWSIVDNVLGFSRSPQARSYFLYWLSKSDLSIEPLLDRMVEYNDDWRSTSVVAAVSLIPLTNIDPTKQESWKERFRLWYREHPSAGAHAGIRLMLQKWGCNAYVDEVDASPEFRSIANDRNWYMNSQGMQMSIVRGPVEFWFGNNPTDKFPGSLNKIEYSFAVSEKLVSEVQYARFRPEQFPSPKELPVLGVNFFDSIAYCDWLSGEERLATGQSIKWIDENQYQLDFLKGGYRLPETTEWECYARGGTTGSFDFGEPDAEYAKSFQQNISVGPRFFDPSWKVGAEWTHPAHKSTKSVRDIVFDSSFHAIWLKSFKTPGFNGGLSRPKEKLEHCFRVLLPLNNEVK